MNPFLPLLLAAAAAAPADSVDILTYVTPADAGRSGLRIAWRPTQADPWTPLTSGEGVVKCDFGAWGAQKAIYRPQLSFADGRWTATWDLDPTRPGRSTASSADLVEWTVQHYYTPADNSLYPEPEYMAVVAGDTVKGVVTRAPRTDIDLYVSRRDHYNRRLARSADRLADDSLRFASLRPFKVDIKVDTKSAKSVSDMLMGVFFEDLNYAADGGLYGELVQNRDFEYSSADWSRNPQWGPLFSWSLDGSDDTVWTVMTDSPIHPNNPHYIDIKAGSRATSLVNAGYDGIPVRRDSTYILSLFVRIPDAVHEIGASLVTPSGKTLASTCILPPKDGDWHRMEATLRPDADADSARLKITLTAGSHAQLDMVSLFPRHTFRGRRNGLRADLAETIAALRPRFVRFPGGCLVHGDGVDNIYHWKETVGPLEARKGAPNIWRYHQSRGLGYYEFFQFCEDMGAEPLPVVAAGVPCQNSNKVPAHHSHSLVTTYGQQCGIPMEEMGAYIQDILDLVEWANGDSTTTWGRLRAEAGHPEPFNLKYLGVGNEDLISPVFEERYRMICDSLRKYHPEIKIVGTAGPWVQGSDYTAGWRLAEQMNLPVVDEHNYNSPGWFMDNVDFYDSYPRTRSAVYLGEYACHISGRKSTLETALCTALFLTGVERNSDIVRMTSYAPLLARHGHTQWNPDLIYFDGVNVYPTVDYEVQRLFGNAAGDTYIPSSVTTDSANPEADRRLGVSVMRSEPTGATYIKVVNLLPVEITASIDYPVGKKAKITRSLLTGAIDSRTARPVTDTVSSIAEATYPPYSLTVYTIE